MMDFKRYLSSQWITIFLCGLSFCCMHTEAQPGYTSIDCGGTANYSDGNGISWMSDSYMGAVSSEGDVKSLDPPPYTTGSTPLSTIRYFPGNHSKYCYVFTSEHGVQKDSAYLVRASFWAGSAVPYTTQVPNRVSFDLLIYTDLWDKMTISLPQIDREDFREMYILAIRDSIDVCLVGNSSGTDVPFISSLELRLLDPTLKYVSHMANKIGRRPLLSAHRINYGAPSAQTYIRYQEDGMGDKYDRIWLPNTTKPILKTTSIVDSIEGIPIRVLQTAYEEQNSIELSFRLMVGRYYFIFLHFAEISPNVTGPGQRVFDFQVLNGTNIIGWWDNWDPYVKSGGFTNSISYYYTNPIYIAGGDDGHFGVSFQRKENSTYGPMICGLDLLQVFDRDISWGTNYSDVSTMTRIISSFPSLNGWSGDPCLPYAYDWITCTNGSRPNIYTISLEHRGLGGEIPSDFNNLTLLTRLSLAGNNLNGSIPILDALQHLNYLDLHGNQLSGEIPGFLGDLPELTTINLNDNNFSGDIPKNLQKKASEMMLNLSVAGNPGLCSVQSNQDFCNTSPKIEKGISTALIAGPLAGGTVFLAFVIGIICYLSRFRNRENRPSTTISILPLQDTKSDGNKSEHDENVLPEPLPEPLPVEKAPKVFTYQEIKTMSQNFRQQIGQGGFGIVYLGNLNGLRVAIKVLSADSYQEKAQFQNEVGLLSRVHHRNLVPLVGYCNEEFIIVYEYMEKGSLFDCLNGQSEKFSVWIDRLQIAVDVAEGLEYMHKHCSPPIIHRDVKSKNILINKDLVAKLSDFGISKSVNVDPSASAEKLQTMVLIGDRGYMDPDYLETRIPTYSVDVYAFGVVLFELITGKPPMIQGMGANGKYVHIFDWAKGHIDRGEISVILDPSLSADMKEQSLMMAIEVAMSCVDRQGEKRPTIDEIKRELQKALHVERGTVDLHCSEEIFMSRSLHGR